MAALNRVALGTQTVSVWKDSRALGKAAGEIAVALASGTAMADVPQTSGIIKFASDGSLGFGYFHPVYVDGKYDGMMAFGYNVRILLDHFFDEVFAKSMQGKYYFVIAEDGNEFFSTLPDNQEVNPRYALETEVQIAARPWRFKIYPTPEFLSRRNIIPQNAVLIVGFQMSFLSSLTLFLFIRLYEKEKTLRFSRDQLTLFIQNTPAAIAMCDKNMRYLVVSERWYKDFRIDDINIIGMKHSDVFPSMPWHWNETLQRCLAGHAAQSEEERIVLKSGRVMWMRWAVHPWHEKDGEIGGIIMFTEDNDAVGSAAIPKDQFNQYVREGKIRIQN